MRNTHTLVVIALVYFLNILITILNNNSFYIIVFISLSFIWLIYELNKSHKEMVKDRKLLHNKLKRKLEKTDKKSKERKERFLILTESIGSGLIHIDIDSVIKYVNKDFKDFFGDIGVNIKYDDVIENEELKNFISDAFLFESKHKQQIKINDRIFDVLSTPLIDNNWFIGCIILIHDITTLKEAELMQKSFIADASHELRTPITAIKGFVEILLRDNNIGEETRSDFLKSIQKEGVRLENLTNDLLELSMYERVNFQLNYSNVNIKEVTKEVINTLENKIKKKNLTIIDNSTDIFLKMDEKRIYQVISNIIFNAITYTNDGYISIETYEKNNKVYINIKDSGIGIEQTELYKIFERFYRVDKARSSGTGGTGLGLAISKLIIQKHSGHIEVESEIGKGSIFKIILPK